MQKLVKSLSFGLWSLFNNIIIIKPWASKAKICPKNVLNYKGSAAAFEPWQHYQRELETLLWESSIFLWYLVTPTVWGAMVWGRAQREAGRIFSGAPKPHSNISHSALCELRTTIEYKPEAKDPWSLKNLPQNLFPHFKAKENKRALPHAVERRTETKKKTS